MNVLFLEDESNARWGVTALLKAQGHSVVEVETADDALAKLHDHRYDLLIVDIMLQRRATQSPLDVFPPRELGYRLVTHLRGGELGELSTPHDVPVLAITAVAVKDVLTELSALPRTCVLTKPIDPPDAIVEIEKLLRKCEGDRKYD
jgi:CheY-like chemotaxis protein